MVTPLVPSEFLSSTKAERVTFSEVINKIMFVVKLLQSMKISVKLVVTVRVDNVNVTTTR